MVGSGIEVHNLVLAINNNAIHWESDIPREVWLFSRLRGYLKILFCSFDNYFVLK